MYRTLMEDLKKWKASERRKPLLLNGARQVGKTYLLKEFGRTEFSHTVFINLDTEKSRYEDIFSSSIKPADIISKLELAIGEKITPNDTLIIFDEIQEVPAAIASLKYFCEDAPEYYVAASGSLLGVALADGVSFPVGKVDMLELSPLSFEEFLLATGNKRFLNVIKDQENIELFKDKLELLFRQYLIVGGMPEAVDSWASRQDYSEVSRIQDGILLAYLNDISKHTDKNTAVRIHQVWNSLPSQFAKRNEKFMFGLIKDGARAREYELAVQWLVDCHIVRKVSRIKTGDKLPLKAYMDEKAFKLYFLDIGLFRKMCGLNPELILSNDSLFSEFGGYFAEQFVLEQLGQKYDFYYWSSDASAEVDFVAEINNGVVPIEVKSGNNVKAKSLKVFRDNYQPKLSLRFSLKNIEYSEGLLNIPLYSSGFVDEIVEKYAKF